MYQSALQTQESIQSMQREFLDILHHDVRKGITICIEKDSDKNINHFSADGWKNNSTSQDKDIYITLNSFKSYSRKMQNVFNYTGFFIDLDLHEGTQANIDKAVFKTEKHILKNVNEGFLPMPTMMTKTGRGMGLFYVLANSVNAQNVGMVKLYKIIYKNMLRTFEEILCDGMLEVDKAVKDASRVCRLVGTYNQHNKRLCTLSSVNKDDNGNTVYYSLEELIRDFKVFEKDSAGERKEKEAKVIDITKKTPCNLLPIWQNRMEALCDLQKKRASQKVGWRDIAVFIATNCLVQMNSFDYEKTLDDVLEFNKGFSCPLPSDQVESIVDGVKNNTYKSKDGTYWKGYYKLSDEWISNALNLSDNEKKQYRLTGHTARVLKSVECQNNKRERAKKVLELAKAKIDGKYTYTYAQIAEIVGLDIRTVKRLLSGFGYARNKNAISNSEKKMPKYMEEHKIITFKKEGKTTSKKRDKKCHECYVCEPVQEYLATLTHLLPASSHCRSVLASFQIDLLATYHSGSFWLAARYLDKRFEVYKSYEEAPLSLILNDIGHLSKELKDRGILKQNIFDRPL